MFKSREIVFVDLSVDDVDTLIRGVREELPVVMLDGRQPALRQIADALKSHHGLDLIHVIAHGSSGEIRFGSGAVSLGSVSEHVDDLSDIGSALGADGRLLWWSCETGSGPRGRAFVEALEDAIGAPVHAASASARRGSAGPGCSTPVPANALPRP